MKTNLQHRTWRWNAVVFFALTFLTILSERGFAKDTVYVTSDLTSNTEGNLNNAINDIITADPTGNQISNTVFKLESYGYYILTGTITTPRHSHLTIVAPEPGYTQESAPPQIVWSTSSSVTGIIGFDCFGDLTMKNIWLLCARTSGTQLGMSIVIEDDTLASESGKGQRLEMDGCIIDYMNIGNGGGAITPSCRNFRGKITNTYFRNLTDPHYRYYGRPVSWTFQSTQWHTDTLIFENCTIANVGYGYMQEAPCYADYVSFNHCTFVNTMMFTLESSYWWWLSVTNCVFVNSYMFGYIPVQSGFNPFGTGGMISIDSVSNFGFSVPFTDSKIAATPLQRHILLANNSYGYEQWYIDYLNNNPYNPPNADEKIHRMPMMNQKTHWFFTSKTDGIKNFPYMNMIHIYPEVDTIAELPATYNSALDPHFFLSPTNIDSIMGFLNGRWWSGIDFNWAFNPQEDVAQIWPMSENLSYTNATLKTAGMSGFPLGDLYHWWPAEYASWKAQASTERQWIMGALANGTGFVILNTPELISPAINSQNQPVDSLTMQWHFVSLAGGYNFQLSLNPSFTQLVENDSTADTTIVVKSLNTSTKYFWRVRAYSNDGNSQFSPAFSFTTILEMPATPTLISPISNAVDQPAKIKLICSKTSDAVQYQWQVSLTDSFTTFAINDSTTDSTFTSIPLEPNTKYYWRVRGFNSGFTGNFSNVDSFTVMQVPAAPVLIPVKSDPGPLRIDTLIVRWHSVPTATWYEFQLSQTQSFTTIIVKDSTMDTIYTVTSLNDNTVYFWRVRAHNNGGVGEFSDVSFFTTPDIIPLFPQLVFPIPNLSTVNRDPKFIWMSSKNASNYHLQVSESQLFAPSIIDTIIVDTFMRVTSPLKALTIYFWHVSAIGSGGESPFSPTRYFVTSTIITMIEENSVPKEFALFQNYPNPFNPVTQIKYSVPQIEYVSLKVYNLMGQEVAILFEGIRQPGNYIATFSVKGGSASGGDAKGFASGIYLYRMTAGNFVETRKLLLLK